MSKHRMKNISYDDDDFEDDEDEGYDSEEQAILEQCTTEVIAQLRAGDPAVTASKDEVQEALWHYYNDVGKAVGYLRGMSGLFSRLGRVCEAAHGTDANDVCV